MLRRLAIAVLIGGATGTLLALSMSYMDWRLNPGGIFQSSAGTNWAAVRETWISWFIPAFLLASIIATAVLVWKARRA